MRPLGLAILLVFLTSGSNGMKWVQDNGFLMNDHSWSFLKPLINIPSSQRTPEKIHLGQYQMRSPSGIMRDSFSIADEYWVPMYHCKQSGYFSMSGSCRVYYECEETNEPGLFEVYLLFCPHGTVFNDHTKICDYVSQVMTRPECRATMTTIDNFTARLTNCSLSVSSNSRLQSLNRRKRIAVMTALTGLLAIGSLTSAAVGITGAVRQGSESSGGINLHSIENKLAGMDGKLKNLQLSVLESQVENRINSKITQRLIVKGSKESQANFEITQSLIEQGILENRINTAVIQGLIAEGNAQNELNFVQVQVSLGQLQDYMSQEITNAKAEIKNGFESVLGVIDRSRIQSAVSTLLTLIKNYSERLNHLQSLPEKNKKDEIERSGGFLEYLESSTLQNTLYDIIHQDFAVPSSSSDTSAVLMLDLLIQGLQIHASMLSSIISSNVLLAIKALDDKNLDDFNTYMLRVTSSVSRVKSAIGQGGEEGLIGEVKGVLNKVQNLPYMSAIPDLNHILLAKRMDLDQLLSDIEILVKENTELNEPGTIRKKPDFSSTSISVPLGPWVNGKQVSYAIQHISTEGLSRIGEWTSPYTIQDKANPSIEVPRISHGLTCAIYRRFNQEKPELVALMSGGGYGGSDLHDMGRDLLNAAARPNENIALTETRSLIANGANVDVTLERKMTPLHYAAKSGNVQVMDVLLENNADIHAKTKDNEQPLHFAALFGSKEGVEFLINNGARINAQTKLLGLSPLHIAVANGNVPATQALLSNDAFINVKDNSGLTPLHLAVVGNGATIVVLLRNENVDVNAVTNDGLTPLHYAAKSSNAVFVQKLMEISDTDVKPLSKSGLTPLHFAAVSGNTKVIIELIQRGAPYSAADDYGSIPLHYAAFYGNREAALALLQMDQSMENVKNNGGKTPRDLAVENDQKTVVEILNTSTDDLVNIITEELKDDFDHLKPQNTEPILGFEEENEAECSTAVVESMAKSTEATCTKIGDIEAYVNLVVSMVPLQKYYENHEEFSVIFGNYDRDLGIAKEHAKVWRNGDSIVKGIRKTFQLVKEFESQFNTKYNINKRRVKFILSKEKDYAVINETMHNIAQLEEDLTMAQSISTTATTDRQKAYFARQIQRLQSQIAQKKSYLEEDQNLIEELQELKDFLVFVKRDSSAIQEVALKTKGKIEVFRENLVGDKGKFERHASVADITLQDLLEEAAKKDAQLIKNNEEQKKLQIKIDEQDQKVRDLDAKIEKAHADLRKIRRELLDKLKTSSTLTIIGAFGAVVSPLLITVPLLIYASVEEKKTTKQLQSTMDSHKQEVDTINSQIKTAYAQIALNRELIANSTSNSDKIRSDINTFSTVNLDLKDLKSKADTLIEAIDKAIGGVVVLKNVFDVVTDKLDEMIKYATEAKTEADRLYVKHFLYVNISILKCNWIDVSAKIMYLHECTEHFQILY